MMPERMRAPHEHLRRDVGNDDVRRDGGVLHEVRLGDGNEFPYAVLLRIMPCARNGNGVDIGEVAVPRPEFGGGNAQDAAPAPDVEHDFSPLYGILQKSDAHGRRLVFSRAECHVGIEEHDLLFLPLLIGDPFGDDGHPPEGNGAEVLLPNFDPIIPLDLAGALLEGAEVDGALRPIAAGVDLLHGGAHVPRPRKGQEGLDERLRPPTLEGIVEVIPIDAALARLQGNDVRRVRYGNAALRVVP